MRFALLSTLATTIAAQASLAAPPSLPSGSPIPGGIPGPGAVRSLCTDLAIVGWNGTRSVPGAPLGPNEVAIAFSVRNDGPLAYSAPDENKKWIALVMSTPMGARTLATNVLPPQAGPRRSTATHQTTR